MSLYRIHIKTAGILGRQFAFDYCLRNQMLGLGYQTKTDKKIFKWEDYETEARVSDYTPRQIKYVSFFRRNVKKDDLIWTRSPIGEYFLAKVNSGWEYFLNEDAKKADIVNIVRCDIKRIPSLSDVPGKVVSCFTVPLTFQPIQNEACLIYSQYLWNELNTSDSYKRSNYPLNNIFSFLSPEEAEDLVFVYLQTEGWIVIPNSRKADTKSFEFIAKNKTNGEVAAVQVKTGGVHLDINNYKDRNDISRTFLFQTNNYYLGYKSEKVECLSPEFMNQFIEKNLKILPANITRWHEIVSKSL